MAQVLSETKYNARMTPSFRSYEASSLKTSWDKEDLLGRGSFATARRCIHNELGRVVTKCFKVEGLSVDKDKVMMNVEREMKVLYRLKHQHIVAVHGITEWSNCVGIIMEHAEAGNLDFFLWLPGDIADIPLLLQLRFAHQISDGLRYLHHHDKKRSYLHCDLKPENILLTPDLMVKIADFGSVAIATATGVTGGSFTITSTTQHTPFYTAPELLGNILSDKKTSMDVYSYGMVLYAILTRHPAFSSDEPVNPGIIMEVIIHRGQKPKQKYLDDVESSLKDKPEDLEIFKFLKAIMVRCWDFEAKNRPDIQEVYGKINEKLNSLNKSDVTYHISDLKKNEEPEPTPSSVKIELSEFSSPFEIGPQPSTAYLPISEQSSSTSATSIQDEVNAGSSTLTTRESPGIKQGTSPDRIISLKTSHIGLEIMIEKILFINDLISNQQIEEALTVCKYLISTIIDLKSAMKTTFLTGDDAINVGNGIINLMSTLSREKYSPTILTLLLLAGDLHKQIDDPTEKVKLMERCAVECLEFVLRYYKNLQRTTCRHVISRMTGFVQSIQSVKVDDEKLAATSKAQCWSIIALCHGYLGEYSRAIEVLQLAIATFESTFGDGCRKMWLYSLCCNNIGVYYDNNNQPEEAEAFYIKSIHAHQEVEDESEQWKMESCHDTINNLCELHQDYPTMMRDKGSDVYNFLQKRKHLTGLSRFWNMLSSLRLMILLNLDGDVKAICNKLVTMATDISPPTDQCNDLCIDLRATAELLSSKNDEESAMSLLECVDKFEK
ncbi:unnamed protein product [Clavelina lepadiformis]|uniref:Protein kinase domain-containing protein n=1 Tax=Clavelina lepadiformis TaxID=159417 RepID=A0ABP0FRE5_CLALP